MRTPADIRQKLLELTERVCDDGGYELVDVEYTRGQSGWIVRVYMDRAASDVTAIARGGISFDDCEQLSRQLSALFDVEDPVPHAYSLEVSSPGLDRPLRTAAHFRRFLGESARVALHEPLAGRRNFKGALRALEPAEGGDVLVMDVDGNEFRLPLAGIASARLVPDWDSLMRGNRGGDGTAGQRG